MAALLVLAKQSLDLVSDTLLLRLLLAVGVPAVLVLVDIAATAAPGVEVLLRVRVVHRWLRNDILGGRVGPHGRSHARRVDDVACAAAARAVFGLVGLADEALSDNATIGVAGE